MYKQGIKLVTEAVADPTCVLNPNLGTYHHIAQKRCVLFVRVFHHRKGQDVCRVVIACEARIEPLHVVRGNQKNRQLCIPTDLLGPQCVTRQSDQALLINGQLLLVRDEDVHFCLVRSV